MKKMALQRRSAPFREAAGHAEAKNRQKFRVAPRRLFVLTFCLLKKNMRAARAIVDTEIVVATDTNEKKALATRVVWNDLALQ